MRPELDGETAARLARIALDGVEREYPNHLSHYLAGEGDVGSPRALHPAFYGCLDWHSSVHSHWTLARLRRAFPEAPWVGEVDAALGRTLTPANVEVERAYLAARPSYERPYGLAWLLLLADELRGTDEVLAPLESVAVAHLSRWLPRLPYAIRVGTHSQTAFAMGMALDATADAELRALLRERALAFHRDDVAAFGREPSGHDFLSPSLAEADLMRRVLAPPEFARWLARFWVEGVLEPVVCPDPTDGHLAHLDGLNLSRAWMLEGIASGLPEGDPRRGELLEMATAHGVAGLGPALAAVDYMGSHWLGSFAVYYLTRAGLAVSGAPGA